MPGVISSTDFHRLAEVRQRAIDALLSVQKNDGHWCGELQGDSILESEYILMKFILGQERQPMAAAADGTAAHGWQTLTKIANYLRRLQRDDGGWGQFPGSGVDLSATVKAYFALKLMGDDPASPHMKKAREVTQDHGGAERCNSFTNFYLACLGQISWNAVPAIPPELVFLPRWFPFHMSKVSAWTRTMILPLSLVVTLRPMRAIPCELGIDELFLDHRVRHTMKNKSGAPAHWSKLFIWIDWLLKLAHRWGLSATRHMAVKRAERWILDRAGQVGSTCSDGLGAIFPPMVYLQIAFMALGYKRSHPVIQRAERELDDFFIEDKSRDEIRIQPCFSPVWDTGIALYALTDCGMTNRDAAIRAASNWLIKEECRHVGDWADNIKTSQAQRYREVRTLPVPSTKNSGPGLGCWYFEYHNAWYPDCDDTAMVAMALRRAGGKENTQAAQRGVQWLLAMQNDDGGWAAFDKTRHRQWLEYIPFADHNAMQDPSCPDITGRVLECLSWHGFDNSHPAVRKAIEYIKHTQVEIKFSELQSVNSNSSISQSQLNSGALFNGLTSEHSSHNGSTSDSKPLQSNSKSQISDFKFRISNLRSQLSHVVAGAIEKAGSTFPNSPIATFASRQSFFTRRVRQIAHDSLGCWFGRWGVNYIYGTWQAVIGPIRCGEDPNQDWIVRAGEWIKSIQKDDGSFGESANSYEDPLLKGQGPSTASQTAWGAMILQEIYGKDDLDLKRAIDWLASTQLSEADAPDPQANPDGDPAGSWVETWFTGTGFPRVFYLRYHLYRLYFPLMAIGRYLAAHEAAKRDTPTARAIAHRESVTATAI